MDKVRLGLVTISLVLSVIIGLVLARGTRAGAPQAGANEARPRDGELRIGFSMDTLKEARWQVDRRAFEAHVKALGAVPIVLAANGDDTTQIGDVEKLITRGVGALVIVPHDAKAMAKAVDLAHEAGIPVISYDRLIQNADVDLYVSFENVKVGEQQARYLVDHLPTPGKGKIVRIHGSKTDNNSFLLKEGQDHVLAPYLERGDIVVVHEDWTDEWKPENAKKIMNAALTKFGAEFDAVLAANDGTAGGALQALTEEGLSGKLVTGQDAELVACQRIATGAQAMTIYKPIDKLAQSAAELAVRLSRGQPVIARSSVHNGKLDVPAVLSEVVTVTRDNLRETVILDGFHSEDAVYGSAP